MKFKMIALVLGLTVLSWAQTATQNPSQPAQGDAKASCPCCQKMADSEEMKSCCSHHGTGKAGEPTSCCAGKDAKACMKGDKDKSVACQSGKCCGANGNKDCCAKCAAEGTAMACCGGQCSVDRHDHASAN